MRNKPPVEALKISLILSFLVSGCSLLLEPIEPEGHQFSVIPQPAVLYLDYEAVENTGESFESWEVWVPRFFIAFDEVLKKEGLVPFGDRANYMTVWIRDVLGPEDTVRGYYWHRDYTIEVRMTEDMLWHTSAFGHEVWHAYEAQAYFLSDQDVRCLVDENRHFLMGSLGVRVHEEAETLTQIIDWDCTGDPSLEQLEGWCA